MKPSIYLNCDIEKEDWYKDPLQLQLYIYLLIQANHTGYRKQGIQVDNGQVMTSKRTLMKELKMNDYKLRKSLAALASTAQIKAEATRRYTLITIADHATPFDSAHTIHTGTPQLGVGEWMKDNRRYYGNHAHPVEVPADISPRPSAQHTLDKANKRWLIL